MAYDRGDPNEFIRMKFVRAVKWTENLKLSLMVMRKDLHICAFSGWLYFDIVD